MRLSVNDSLAYEAVRNLGTRYTQHEALQISMSGVLYLRDIFQRVIEHFLLLVAPKSTTLTAY